MPPRACALQQGKPPQWEACALQLASSSHLPQLEKSPSSNEDPAQPKINKWNYIDTHIKKERKQTHCSGEKKKKRSKSWQWQCKAAQKSFSSRKISIDTWCGQLLIYLSCEKHGANTAVWPAFKPDCNPKTISWEMWGPPQISEQSNGQSPWIIMAQPESLKKMACAPLHPLSAALWVGVGDPFTLSHRRSC